MLDRLAHARGHLPCTVAAALLLLMASSAAATAQDLPPSEEDGDDPRWLAPIDVEAAPSDDLPPPLHRRSVAVQPGSDGHTAALAGGAGVQLRPSAKGDLSGTFGGFRQRQVAFTLEGAPLAQPYDGAVSIAALPAAWFAAVTHHTPGADLGNGGSMGGGVDLSLRAPGGEGPLIGGELSYASPWGGEASLWHHAGYGPLRWVLVGGLAAHDPWRMAAAFTPTANEDGHRRDNSDRQQAHALARVEADVGQGRLGAHFGWIEAERGLPPSTTANLPRYWRFSTWRSVLSGVHYDSGPADTLRTVLRTWVHHYHNVLDAYDDATYQTRDRLDAFTSRWNDWSLGLSAHLSTGPWALPLGDLDLALRGEVQLHRHQADARDPLHQWQIEVAPGANWELTPAWRLLGEVGLSANYVGDPEASPVDPWAKALFATLGADWEPPGRPWRLGLRLLRSVRLPTLKEWVSDFGTAFSDTGALRPESAWTARCAASWRPASWLLLSSTLSASTVRDLLEATWREDGSRTLANLPAAYLLSGELGLRLGPWAGLGVDLSYQALLARTWDAHAALAYRPPHHLDAVVRYQPLAALQLWVRGEWLAQQRAEDPFQTRDVYLGARFVLDAGAAYDLGPVHLWGKLANALDMAYADAWGYPAPGRALMVGLRLETSAPQPDE